jgi:integrase/recombinase XerD
MGSQEEDMPLSKQDERMMASWLLDLSLERDLSDHSLKAYGTDLRHLLRWLVSVGETIQSATTKHLIKFLGARSEAGDGATTRARRLAAIRSFFRWLKDTGRSEKNPSLLLPRGRKPELLPKALTEQEIKRLIEALPDGSEPKSLRDRAVIELLYGAGLRASEAAGLQLKDLDLEASLLRILGKGNRERRVPLGTPCAEALSLWIRQGRPRFQSPRSDDTLFLNPNGTALTRGGVYNIVKVLVRKAGLPSDVSPHTLRHTFATHLVHGGADLRAVQELLGHASINTTQIYTNLLDHHLRETHRRFHPRG